MTSPLPPEEPGSSRAADSQTINSQEYWDRRFSMDWEAAGGRQQSRAFMDLLVKFLPAVVYEAIAAGGLSLLDCGCAMGDGTAVLAHAFPASRVAGFDLSPTAVERARQCYPELELFACDFLALERKADVLVSSNCFEHLERPLSALVRLTSCARRYVLLLVPYLESFPTDPEHVRVVHADTFPETVSGWRLAWRIGVPPSPAWSQHQMLLIYEPVAAGSRLSPTPVHPAAGGPVETALRDLERAVERLRSDVGAGGEEAGRSRDAEEAQRQELAARLEEAERVRAEAARQAQGLAREVAGRDEQIAGLQADLQAIHGSRLWRIGHGYWSLLRWLRRSVAPPPTSRPVSHEVAHEEPEAEAAPLVSAPPPDVLLPEAPRPGLYDVLCLPIIDWEFRFQRPQQLMLQFARRGHRVFYVAQGFRPEGEPYRLRLLASNVWEVSLRGSPRNVYTEGLEEADRDQLLAGLDALRRDLSLGATVAMVELPFWAPLAEAVWSRLGWPTVYDCMDDHAGFSTNRPEMLAAEEGLLAGAQLVIASSQRLLDHCRKRSDKVLLLPNACDYEHFSQVGPPPRGARPVVGYYGAIADWFDSDLVADLAERRPDWDFVLVGSTYTGDVSRLSVLPNVALPGEQPYASLPGWLDRMDVLLLPFRRLPLTEATNPVKAYEILAAGRPLVSVPLPEMVAMSPRVRLAADAEQLEAEIVAALAADDPAEVEARRAFARDNTWERRHAALAPRLREAFPRASIVIVTFNNLELNRLCLESLYERTEWPNFEVLVVDNASTDGTARYLAEAQKRFLSLHVLLNDRNLGFAAANNLALAKASGDFLVLLNNDTVVPRGWLTQLIRHLHADPGIGLLGPVSNAISNQARVEVGYDRVEQMPAWAERHVHEHDGELFPIPMLAMFCLAMRREVFARVGALDERFGVGMFEDDDYSRRAEALGYQVVCARDTFVHHWQKSSFRLLGESEYLRLFERNRRLYEEKWGEAWNPEGVDLDPSLYAPAFEAILERVRSSRGAVVFLPSIGWDIHLFQRPHHLARAFAALGYVVLFDCTGSHENVEGFREVEPNLFLFQGEPTALQRLASPIVWSFPYNFHQARELSPGAVTVYDWIDDLAVFPYERELLEANHRRALAEATVVACVARKLEGEARPVRPDVLYVPNGVEPERFAAGAPAPDDPKLTRLLAAGRPIAGYYGAFAEWFDYELLDEVACRRPDWSFLLIGPMYDGSLQGQPLLARPNVVWTGPRDYLDLPGYLRCFDVALIPFRINEITRATSPLKLYEYLAGGRPVITTPMPECQAFPEVRIVRDGEELARALDAALADRRDERVCEGLREIARQHSWTARLEGVLARIEEVSGSGLSAPAREMSKRFRRFWRIDRRTYFNALCEHLAALAGDPCLPMYFEYAVTSVERGRGVARLLAERTELARKSYLDVGCAYGGFLAAMAERGARVTGIDLDDKLLRLARIHLAELKVPALILQHDATEARPEFRRRFDVVTANDVIEHVRDLDALLRNLHSWLRPGGLAYLEIPNGAAARAVASDGHYQLFGITLLDFEPARSYYQALHPGAPYDTYNYLDLSEYGERFAAAGLSLEVLPETLAGLGIEQAEEDLRDLGRRAPEGLLSVPAALRSLVAERLDRYLATAAAAPRATVQERESFLLRYGAGFWKVLARQVGEA